MSSLVTEETVKNLTEENIRLCEELVFIRERMKMLIEFKIMFDLHSNKIKQSLDLNEWQTFEKVLKRINDFAKTRVTKSGNPIVEINTLPPQIHVLKQPQEVKEVVNKQEVVKRLVKRKPTIKMIKLSYVGPEKKEVRSVIDYQPKSGIKAFYRTRPKCTYEGCDKTFADNYNRDNHVKKVHFKEKDLFCEYPECPYKTFSRKAFDQHIANHSDYVEVTSGKTNYPCSYEGCGKVFAHKKTWINHYYLVHKYARKVPCTHPGCDYATVSKANLRVHLVTHSDDKPFVCSVEDCGRSFKRKIDYKRHLDIHKNKYFKCPFDDCSKTFQTDTGLRRHKISVHTKDKLYSCEWPGCEYSTYSLSSYRSHERVHSDRKYLCDYPNCNSKYRERSYLRAHQLKHHGIGEGYVCSWPGCEHKAITKSKLKIHEKSHNKDN